MESSERAQQSSLRA